MKKTKNFFGMAVDVLFGPFNHQQAFLPGQVTIDRDPGVGKACLCQGSRRITLAVFDFK